MGKWVELPSFSLCCFCIPLRPGLITWAAVLTITQILMLAVTSSQISAMNTAEANAGPGFRHVGKEIVIAFLVLIILDIISAVVLVLAVFKALDRLFKGYFYYSILSLLAHFILVVTYMGLLVFVVPRLQNLPKGEFWEAVLNYGGRGILEILIKLYMVLIVKSVVSEQNKSNTTNRLPGARY